MSEMIGCSFTAWPWPEDDTPEALVSAMGDLWEPGGTFGSSIDKPHGKDYLAFQWQGEWNYGIVNDCPVDTEVLQEAGIAYVIHDEAKYEWSAQVCWWHPGMAQERTDSADQDGGIVMTVGDWEAIHKGWAADEVADAVAAFFADPWEWEPPADHVVTPPLTEEEQYEQSVAGRIEADQDRLGDDAIGDADLNEACNALAVMVLTPTIRAFLEENDPQALAQARKALLIEED